MQAINTTFAFGSMLPAAFGLCAVCKIHVLRLRSFFTQLIQNGHLRSQPLCQRVRPSEMCQSESQSELNVVMKAFAALIIVGETHLNGFIQIGEFIFPLRHSPRRVRRDEQSCNKSVSKHSHCLSFVSVRTIKGRSSTVWPAVVGGRQRQRPAVPRAVLLLHDGSRQCRSGEKTDPDIAERQAPLSQGTPGGTSDFAR
jgi:hypothetical protein